MIVTGANRILKAVAKRISNNTAIDSGKVRVTINPPTVYDWFDVDVTIIPDAIKVRREFGSEGTAGGHMGAGPVTPIVELYFRCIVRTFEYLDEVGSHDIALDDNHGHFYYVRKVIEAMNGLCFVDANTGKLMTVGSIAILSIEPIGRIAQRSIDDRRKDVQINRGVVESSVNCYVAFVIDAWPGSLTPLELA